MGKEIAACFMAGILLLLQSSLPRLFIRGDFPNERHVEAGGIMGYCDLCQAEMGQVQPKGQHSFSLLQWWSQPLLRDTTQDAR